MVLGTRGICVFPKVGAAACARDEFHRDAEEDGDEGAAPEAHAVHVASLIVEIRNLYANVLPYFPEP